MPRVPRSPAAPAFRGILAGSPGRQAPVLPPGAGARHRLSIAAAGCYPPPVPRRIFVGDVQGCADELDEMLERARASFGDDFELWIVGDVVNRGPDSLGALRSVRALVDAGRGHFVLGNHELNLLRVALGLRQAAPLDSIDDVLGAPDRDDWIDWLRHRPLAVAGRQGGQDFAMVHASVHPEWTRDELLSQVSSAEARLRSSRADATTLLAAPSDDRDLDTLLRVTCCRSVDAHGGWSPQPPELAPPEHRAWHDAWSECGHDYGVVYGHWAMQGLHVAPGLRGLDTGCVHHGRGRDGFLTAWLPDPRRETPFSLPDGDFWRVRARRSYYAHRDAVDAPLSD